jgi:hypothetical protein
MMQDRARKNRCNPPKHQRNGSPSPIDFQAFLGPASAEFSQRIHEMHAAKHTGRPARRLLRIDAATHVDNASCDSL